MIFEPVWVSSPDHLQTFARAYRETSYIRMFVGAWKIPEGFPYLEASTGIRWRVPLMIFSSGHLVIKDQLLEFEARPWDPPHCEVYHLRTDLRFELTDRDITGVEPFEAVSPVMRYYNLPFTRIRTTKGGELSDLLLCVGGTGLSMSQVRDDNAELSSKLRETFPWRPM